VATRPTRGALFAATLNRGGANPSCAASDNDYFVA